MGNRHFILFCALVLAMASSVMTQEAKPTYTVRVDYHNSSINPWLFYETPIANDVGLLSVFQMSTLGFAQIDIGPNFHFQQLQIIPQMGFEISESSARGARLSHLVYELYAIFYNKTISFESWNLYFNKTLDEQQSFFYYRDFILLRVLRSISIGPQVEGYSYAGGVKMNYPGGQVCLDTTLGSIGIFMGHDKKHNHNVFRMTFLKMF
jgi:hypothetical protein